MQPSGSGIIDTGYCTSSRPGRALLHSAPLIPQTVWYDFNGTPRHQTPPNGFRRRAPDTAGAGLAVWWAPFYGLLQRPLCNTITGNDGHFALSAIKTGSEGRLARSDYF